MDLKALTEQLKIHEGFRNHVYQWDTTQLRMAT